MDRVPGYAAGPALRRKNRIAAAASSTSRCRSPNGTTSTGRSRAAADWAGIPAMLTPIVGSVAAAPVHRLVNPRSLMGVSRSPVITTPDDRSSSNPERLSSDCTSV